MTKDVSIRRCAYKARLHKRSQSEVCSHRAGLQKVAGLVLLSLFFCFTFFTLRTPLSAQETPPLLSVDTSAEAAQLAEAAQSAKAIYTQLMQAVYLESFDKNLSEARGVYDALIQLHPTSAYIFYKRGQLRYRMQDIRGAEQDSRQALKINADYIPAMWQLAQILAYRAYHTGGDVDNIVTVLKRITKLDPDHRQAQEMLANLARQLREYDTAETALKALTRVMPFEPSFHKQLAELYRELQKPQEAIEAYQRVVKINPRDVRALTALGHLYLATDKLTEAQQVFTQILKWMPNDINGTFGMGLVHQDIARRAYAASGERTAEIDKSISAAETYLQKTITAAEARAENAQNRAQRRMYLNIIDNALNALGQVYLSFENFDAAQKIFTQLLSRNPRHVDGTYSIAAIYQTHGEFEKAEKYLRKTLQLRPNHAHALNALAYLYAEQGTNLDEAENLVRRALEKSPTNGAYLDTLGWVFFKQKRFAKAVETLELANQHLPNTVEILMHLGDAYRKNNEPQKARQALEQAQTIEPENQQIQERLK